MIKDNSGPAFPQFVMPSEEGLLHDGMTLRDYFAAKALQGMYAGKACNTNGDIGGYAEAAYHIADAMIAEREKT